MNNGGPAFPTTKRLTENYMDQAGYGKARDISVLSGGMTLRDYFAAKAMAAYISTYPMGDIYEEEVIAVDAYAMADAMLAARER